MEDTLIDAMNDQDNTLDMRVIAAVLKFIPSSALDYEDLKKLKKWLKDDLKINEYLIIDK